VSGGRHAADGSTDAELAAAAARGDRRCLEVLLERHADRVYAICRRVLSDREDARDAAQ
jgi:RNA polymerase sigma-70 factor (ECF subfamily)